MSLRYAYNTNGAANHRLDDALSLIAEAGYDGVALTLDHHHLDPFAPDFTERAGRLARRLEELGIGAVVETGARFLLDPRRKHEPTLISPEPEGRERRVDFLFRAVEIAAIIEAEAVSFWAGVPGPGLDRSEACRWSSRASRGSWSGLRSGAWWRPSSRSRGCSLRRWTSTDCSPPGCRG